MTCLDNVFKDTTHQEFFKEEGYFIAEQMLSEEELKQIDKLFSDYQESFKNQQGDISFSIFHTNIEFKRKVSKILNKMFAAVAEKYLKDYKTVLGSFAIKFTNKGVFPTHKNLPLVNEAEHVSLSVWMPLQETSDSNGALQVVPGSHKEGRLERRNIDLGIKSELVKNQIKTLPMKRGQMVFFDNSLIHCSDINHSGKPRISVVIQVIPKDLSVIYHDLKPDGNTINVNCHKVDEEFFFDMVNVIERFGEPDFTYQKDISAFEYALSISPLKSQATQEIQKPSLFGRAKNILKRFISN